MYLFFYVSCICVPLIGGLVVWESAFQADNNVLWVWFSLWFLPCYAIALVHYIRHCLSDPLVSSIDIRYNTLIYSSTAL